MSKIRKLKIKKKIYSIINNRNIEINSCFNDIKKKIKEIKPSYSIEEIKVESFKSNITHNISSINSNHIINNTSSSFKENINTFNEIYEEGIKNKYKLDEKIQIFISEIRSEIYNIENSFLLEEIKKFLDKKSNESQIGEKTFGSQQSSNTNNNDSTNVIQTKEDKTLFGVISKIFKVEKYELAKKLLIYLNQIGKPQEYQGEIFKNFNSNINIIYDNKNDGDKFSSLLSKVSGKKNLIAFFSVSTVEKEDFDQIILLKGKFELIDNNNFNFSDSDFIMYGNYSNINKDNSFNYFKSQNSRLYTKKEKDCLYIILYEKEKMSFLAKIRNNFIENPILCIDDDRDKVIEFFGDNPEDKVSKVFDKYKTFEIKFKKLVIYEMPEE